jgi:uncharacterized iron-regulated membrane protein
LTGVPALRSGHRALTPFFNRDIMAAFLMTFLKTWLYQPRNVWLRRILFQVHLWTGLAIGLYIVMLSLSGSILVYSTQIVRILDTPVPEYEPERRILSEEEMAAAATRAFPGYEVTRIGARVTERRPAMSVRLESGGEVQERLFNPYTGEDLGDAFPKGVEAMFQLANLHDDLLLGFAGRRINGFGSILATLLVLTGAVIWWPGRKRWRQSMSVRWRSNWARINWDLHSAAGFWVFALLLIWSVSGVYLAFPEPFAATVDYLSDPNAILGERPGDIALNWLTRLHFGRFRTQPVLQALWACLGLVPAVMFVTGAVMWWNRVLRKLPGGGRDPSLETESPQTWRRPKRKTP